MLIGKAVQQNHNVVLNEAAQQNNQDGLNAATQPKKSPSLLNEAAQQNYNTIISAIQNNNLLAVSSDGNFKEVGVWGRMWRVFTHLGKEATKAGRRSGFEDCYAAEVGNAIVHFVTNNKVTLNPEQKQALINSLHTLRGRLRRNYGNITINIQQIQGIKLGPESTISGTFPNNQVEQTNKQVEQKQEKQALLNARKGLYATFISWMQLRLHHGKQHHDE